VAGNGEISDVPLLHRPPQVVGFSGGEKARAALEAIAARLKTGSVVQVGFLEGSTETDGASLPMVAAAQEFGTRRIPPRPFMRTAVAEHSSEWGPALGQVLKNVDYDANTALGQMGKAIEDQIRDAIKAVTSPPLAPATVKRKGFDKPLIDTSNMWRSVDSAVKE
jgi:hypothetical protein